VPTATFSSPIDAPADTVWRLLLDKIEHPQRYFPNVTESEILARDERGVERRMVMDGDEIVEFITMEPKQHEIVWTLMEHPHYEGRVINRLDIDPGHPPVLTIALVWTPNDDKVVERPMDDAVRTAVLQIKQLAEADAKGALKKRRVQSRTRTRPS
jgi:hypothetical protein